MAGAAINATASVHKAVRTGQGQISADAKEVFERFDENCNGVLEFNEVEVAIKTLLGKDVTKKKVKEAIKQFAKPGADTLDLQTFGDLIQDLRRSAEKYVPLQMHAGSVLGKDKKLPYQDLVWTVYNNNWVVMSVALIIVGNFAINIVEKEIDPDKENMKYAGFWASADTFFNVIFIFELWANMWGHGGPTRNFFKNAWNVFDTIIVLVGFLTMVNALGPPLDKLKLLRAFRVFRLFKRIESLNKIIVALIKSIPGVSNAFLVMFIFFCIYAILAVELFREFGKDGTYETWDEDGNPTTIDAMTLRGYAFGIEYYGTFMRALYTLFQVMTGESWSEVVVRPLLFGLYKENSVTVAIYFTSFIILMQMVLINVVVAVLLDKFVVAEPEAEEELEGLEGEDAAPAADLPLPEKGDIAGKLDYLVAKIDKLQQSCDDLNADRKKLVAHMASMRQDGGAAGKSNRQFDRNCTR